MKARHKASLLTTHKKIGKHFFPSLQFPSLLLHFHLPDGGCALTFAGIISSLEYPDFPNLICLKEINGHYCGQVHPKPELSLFGIPTNGAHPKRDSAKINNWLNNYYLKGQKHKTDKNHFDHQRHFVHFLWASNRGRQVYDMRTVQDDKKTLVFKKILSLQKKTWFMKHRSFIFPINPEFWKKKRVLQNVLK